mgnify:CR=1 FL=1
MDKTITIIQMLQVKKVSVTVSGVVGNAHWT